MKLRKINQMFGFWSFSFVC